MTGHVLDRQNQMELILLAVKLQSFIQNWKCAQNTFLETK